MDNRKTGCFYYPGNYVAYYLLKCKYVLFCFLLPSEIKIQMKSNIVLTI